MYKKIAIAATLSGTLLLGACGVTVGTGPTVPASTDPTVAAIQDAAVKVCGFVPTVTTITGLIASFFPGGAPINQIVTGVAQAVCTAVTPARTLRRLGNRLSSPPMVGGVRIEGYFTR